MMETISDILAYERGHRVSFTNIQRKIDDKCNAAARFLVMGRRDDNGSEEMDL